MPVLLLFLTGAFVISWAIHGVSSVNYALEQTGRMLQLDPALDVTALQTAIDDKLSHLGKQAVTLSLSHEDPDGTVDIAHITAQYDFPIKIPMLPAYSISYQRTTTVVLPVPSS
jgi:hypothetical protein